MTHKQGVWIVGNSAFVIINLKRLILKRSQRHRRSLFLSTSLDVSVDKCQDAIQSLSLKEVQVHISVLRLDQVRMKFFMLWLGLQEKQPKKGKKMSQNLTLHT